VIGCTQSKRVPPGTAGHDHLRVRLFSSEPQLIPGSICTLGVRFDIEEGWHLYGNGRSDSGLPTSIAFDLPSGLEAGDVLWPAPERLVTAGEILDQVYQESVTLLAPLVVPKGFGAEHPVEVVCRLDWLVCGTGCIPGADTLNLTLSFDAARGSGHVSDEDAMIQRTVERLPGPWPEGDAGFQQFWSEGRWVARVAGAHALTFFPSIDCAPLLDPIETTHSESDRLELHVDPRGPSTAPIRGILAVDTGQARTAYRIDVEALETPTGTRSHEPEMERKIES
jgi:hypothetical protein